MEEGFDRCNIPDSVTSVAFPFHYYPSLQLVSMSGDVRYVPQNLSGVMMMGTYFPIPLNHKTSLQYEGRNIIKTGSDQSYIIHENQPPNATGDLQFINVVRVQ